MSKQTVYMLSIGAEHKDKKGDQSILGSRR